MGTLSNILVEPCSVTWNGTDLGFTDGDIEVALEEQAVDIVAHQEGTNVLDKIRTGKNVEISLTLKETALAKLQTLIQSGGAAVDAAAAVTTIATVADSGGSLNNTFMLINTASDAIKYVVWFNVNSEGVEPVLEGYTALEVTLATGATAAAVATALAAALDGLAGFVSTATDDDVTVTNASVGVTSAPSAGTTGFTVAVSTAGSNVLTGWGKSQDFSGMLADSAKLVLHPVALAANNYTRDLAFWKAYPMLNSIVHSGENPRTATVTFAIFPDSSKPDGIRLFVIGDHT